MHNAISLLDEIYARNILLCRVYFGPICGRFGVFQNEFIVANQNAGYALSCPLTDSPI